MVPSRPRGQATELCEAGPGHESEWEEWEKWEEDEKEEEEEDEGKQGWRGAGRMRANFAARQRRRRAGKVVAGRRGDTERSTGRARWGSFIILAGLAIGPRLPSTHAAGPPRGTARPHSPSVGANGESTKTSKKEKENNRKRKEKGVGSVSLRFLPRRGFVASSPPRGKTK